MQNKFLMGDLVQLLDAQKRVRKYDRSERLIIHVLVNCDDIDELKTIESELNKRTGVQVFCGIVV